MNNTKRLYYFINAIVIILAFILLIFYPHFQYKFIEVCENLNKPLLIFTFLIMFIMIHFIKIFRFYLIIMKERMSALSFVKLYIKTTFVNIIMPYKIGEVFRLYCYGYYLNNYKKSFFSIIVERFFDICALLTILIPIEIYILGKLSWLTIILVICSVILLTFYKIYSSFYTFMNRFLIINLSTKTSIRTLKTIEIVYDGINDVKELIMGRSILIYFLSLISWSLEYVMFKLIAKIIGHPFNTEIFSQYLNALLGKGSSDIISVYTISSSMVLGLIMLCIYFFLVKEKINVK